MTQASDTARPARRETAKDHANGVAGGRLVAWAGFVFGSLASVSANVLAARIPPAGASPAWQPSLDAQIGAAVWPIALLLSVEVLARIQWPDGWGWRFARYGGVGVVALCSAVISYGHIHATLTLWGYTELGASVGPLVVDGLMVVAGFALLADRHDDDGDGATNELAEASQAAGIPVGLASYPTFVYQMFNEADELLYVGITGNLTERLATHRRLKPWFDEIAETITTKHQSRAEALATECEIIANQTPKYNIAPGSLWDGGCGPYAPSPAPPATDLDRARQLVQQADAAGVEIGRPRLVKALGITDHRAKVLLKQIREEQGIAVEDNEPGPMQPVGGEAA